MPKLLKEICMPYAPRSLFDMVLDVERYSEFLPWCSSVRVVDRADGYMLADLVAEFKIFSESYRSRIQYDTVSCTIDIMLENGALDRLKNIWRFERQDDNNTLIHFDLDFAFKSAMLNRVADSALDKVASSIMLAFQKRAKELYDE